MFTSDVEKDVRDREDLAVLEEFLLLADSKRLFSREDRAFHRNTRREVREALHRLLVWRRPFLEETRGILWIYENFAERYPMFREMAESGSNGFRALQARLYLALLPYPLQWLWLLNAERDGMGESEIADFLRAEKESILDKVRNKQERRFKLRHFCQVIKAFRNSGEKGVLRIFSLPYLFVFGELLPRVSRRYVLYVEPPMGVVFRHSWWRYFTVMEDPPLFGACSDEDRFFLRSQHNVETTSLAHGDFLEDISWQPPSGEKEYDIVFNATFDDMARKRHGLMLRLLQDPRLNRVRVLFLGRGESENVKAFESCVQGMGLADRVTILANLQRTEIPKHLNRCKMGVHLSLYESACRSIYEFYRSNLPCVVSSSMAGMDMGIFNPKTGMAVPDRELPDAVSFVLGHIEAFSPRSWFLENSGSSNSTRRLNESLQALFDRRGYEWSEDIVALGSSGASRYVSEEDFKRFRPDFDWLLECLRRVDGEYGVTFCMD